MNYHWNWAIFFQTSPDGVHTYLQTLLLGTLWTLATALSAWCVALAMGSLVGVIRTTPHPWLVRIGNAYVELFRNIPLLVQMFLWYFVLPEVLPERIGNWLKQLPDASFYTAVVALGLYTSSRVAEQVQAGITSLARGQRMAALALGLTLPQAYGYVLLPMAYRIILPPLTSEFLNIIKNSAVALTIAADGAHGSCPRHAGVLVPGVRGLHRRHHHLHRDQYRRDLRHATCRAAGGGTRDDRRQPRDNLALRLRCSRHSTST